ncbi:MAG: hypothetical protein Q9187_004966, partial [Circinaria calcarea]
MPAPPLHKSFGQYETLAKAYCPESFRLVQTLLPGNFYTVAVSLMHPLSRGYSHITSSDPNAKPAVNPNYLVHPLDLEIFARHVRFIGTIVRTEPLKSLFKPGGLVNRAAPKDLQDLDAIKEYIKDTGLSSWHPTSTCAMLPREAGGVVDHNLVVHQTKNLRVIDASVMPITPRGNPQSSVYAIAERAADFIKMDYAIDPRRQLLHYNFISEVEDGSYDQDFF